MKVKPVKSPLRRRAFVTGGTGDIGEAIVRRLAEAEYEVHATFNNNKTKADALSKQLGITFWRVEANSPRLLPELEFDTIINNVGINIDRRPLADVPDDSFTETFAANFYLPIYTCRKYIPHMIHSRFGRIININSIYGLAACSGNSPYICSKHALSGLTKALAHDYGHIGITSNEICPGPVESSLIRRIAGQATNTTPAQYMEDLRSEIPAGRLAEPGDIASLVINLASHESRHLNGCSIRVDGGARS